MSSFPVPLAVFAMVVLIVAITQVAKIRDMEIGVHQDLHAKEREHQRKMRELDVEIERIKQQSSCGADGTRSHELDRPS